MAKLPAPEQLLTINDVAALCQVSNKTVRRWIDHGGGTPRRTAR